MLLSVIVTRNTSAALTTGNNTIIKIAEHLLLKQFLVRLMLNNNTIQCSGKFFTL
jgi:hypothetical protein